jgi:hypothetical protein
MRPVASLGLPALLFLALAAEAAGQPRGTALLPNGAIGPCFPTEGTHLIFVQGERLQAAFGLLMERSPTFAGAMAAIQADNAMRMRIGYPRHVLRAHERLGGEDRGGAVFLADGGVFQPHGTILCGVRVVVFTERLEEELLRAGVPERAVVLDLALMIAHEVFGHLVPFAEQKIPVWPTPCRDPDHRRARRITGCAVDRENLIRQELGIAERTSYAQVDGPLLCEVTGRSCRFRRPGVRVATAGAGIGSYLPAPPRAPAVGRASDRPDTRLPSVLAERPQPAFAPAPAP